MKLKILDWILGMDDWLLEHVHGIYKEPIWVRDGTEPGSKHRKSG